MRVGVFGGTFDPVHFGHLQTVEAAALKFRLARVLYVPAGRSPHKDTPPSDPRHRVAMLALALEGRPDWSISFEELDREPPSYTVDTLRALVRRSKADELWLLMGTDALAGLARWKRSFAWRGSAPFTANPTSATVSSSLPSRDSRID